MLTKKAKSNVERKQERTVFNISDKYSITVEKLMDVVHTYTDPIRIEVVMGDAWMTCDEAKHMRNFRLVDCYRGDYNDEGKKETERLLKYYKDVPVWNLTVWVDGPFSSPKGRQFVSGIEARCHYKDMREGWLAERADIKRAKRRAYYKKRREDGDA